MVRTIGLGLLLCLLWCGLGARSAQAEPPTARQSPVYVLSIWTEDADDQADALTRALRWRVRQAPNWSVLETNQSFETLAIALKCPGKPDTACLQRIGDQLKANRFMWGTMDKKKGASGEVSVDLHLWTRGKLGTAAVATYSDRLRDASDESLRAVASNLFAQLVGPEGSAPAPSPDPGVGSEPSAASVPAPSHKGEPSPDSEQRSSAKTAVAYSAVALGVGFLAASAVEATNWFGDKNASLEDRKVVPASVTDVCTDLRDAAALDACNKGRDAVTASTLGWIFAGAGAALVVTGVWLISTDHPARETGSDQAPSVSKSRIDLVPSLGPRASHVSVRVTF